jgi:glucose/mannose-6-phosphate isomerase
MPTLTLDDLSGMRKIDKSNMLGFCVDAASHYKESAKNVQKIALDYQDVQNVIIAGMGGSAIGGEILKDFSRSAAKVPIEISREYRLPSYADKKSLVILASYSGDTEETLSSLLDATRRKCMIFCLSSGGNLIKYAKKLNAPHALVRAGMPPRAAFPHMILPLLAVIEKTHVTTAFSKEFSEVTQVLEKISNDNSPEKPAKENFAKNLAQNLKGSAPAVYGFGIYRGVALRFKQQFNENAKVPAKWETFSELNHNETMGWENPEKLAKCYAVVFLRDKSEPLEIRSRIETTKNLMHTNLPKMFEVWAQGKSNLAKILSKILVGDFTSVYLAMLRGLDPTPVNTVTIMKEQVEQNGIKQKILRELEEISA